MATNILDLTQIPERPTVKLETGEFKMRLPEELTLVEFMQTIQVGRLIVEAASDMEIGEEASMIKAQKLIEQSANLFLVDLTPEAAASITPGMLRKMSNFFGKLATTEEEKEKVKASNLGSD